MPSKPLQHCHAIVALAFESKDARQSFVEKLAGPAGLDATSIESFTHEDRPAAIIHLRHRARGANMHDISRRLAKAARVAGVEYQVIHEPKGFSVKRPELEEDYRPRATTEPTDPVRADWTQVGTVGGPDVPFQGALRVPLLGAVDSEWLAALGEVAVGTDVLDAIVEDATLYVPDPWRNEPALTQAGEARHVLREAVTQFLNLVNDEYANRTTPHDVKNDRKAFDALVTGAMQLVASTPGSPGRPYAFSELIFEWRTGVGVQSRESVSRHAMRTPPATEEERDAAIDGIVRQAAEVVARRGERRAALVFTSWVGDEPWVVVHVCDRERAETRQTPVTLQVSDQNVASLKARWESVPDRGRFRAMQNALQATTG